MQLQSYEAGYEQLAQDPERWLSSARNLLAASDLLWVSRDADLIARDSPSPAGGHHADVAQHHATPAADFLRHAPVYLMLAGFAVENALKAIRVKQDRARVTKGQPGEVRISGVVQTHDLCRLAKDARIKLSPSEKDLLERLEAFLLWAGRYPVAATAAGGEAAVQVIWRSDQDTIRTFFDRLAGLLLP